MNTKKNIEIIYTDKALALLRSDNKDHFKIHYRDDKDIEKSIEYAAAFFPELTGHEIIVLFTHDPNRKPKVLGTTHPPLCPIMDEENPDVIELRRIRPSAFIINFIAKIYSLDEIAQLINYSHEFQHVVQYITSEKYYWLCRIMYVLIISMHEEELPTEIDAERVSKKVIESIYGKKRVNEWVLQQMEKMPCCFFARFGNCNVDIGYDLKQKTMELWQANGLEEEIKRLRNEPNITDTERRIIKKYDDMTKEK
jgi:hypothetical protein